MSICIKQSALKILLALSALLITWLTTRYFPVEPDVANSPIVWRHILENGISSIHDWKPTVDNWYFTVYPINFLFYMLLGDDGLVALRLSTAVFSIAIVIAAMLTLRKAFGFTPALFSIILLSLIPYFSYTYGFVSHPFSHNSTNAFGFLCLLISVFN
ncbi:gtrI, partial [Shigella flexneri]|nr:gtrI [Shigella flexneri]EKF9369651.1 gtrI [Shigella flexneri]